MSKQKIKRTRKNKIQLITKTTLKKPAMLCSLYDNCCEIGEHDELYQKYEKHWYEINHSSSDSIDPNKSWIFIELQKNILQCLPVPYLERISDTYKTIHFQNNRQLAEILNYMLYSNSKQRYKITNLPDNRLIWLL